MKLFSWLTVMSVELLRKYRIDLETPPFFNSEGVGIAIFDTSVAFFIARALDKFYNVSRFIPFCSNKKQIYYLLLFPVGVLVHHLIVRIQRVPEFSFLNKKLFSPDINIYKVLFLSLLLYTFTSCKTAY